MKSALAAMALLVAGAAQAEASPVTLVLTDTTYNQVAIADAGFQNGQALRGFQLTIDSAAVARGSFTLHGFVSPAGSTVAGDLADFVSATTVFGSSVSPTVVYSTFATQLTFSAAGLVGGTIAFGNDNDGLTLSGSAPQYSGTFGGDNTRCGASACGVSGQLVTSGYTPTTVPEPLSAALLLSGLAGIVLAHRRI